MAYLQFLPFFCLLQSVCAIALRHILGDNQTKIIIILEFMMNSELRTQIFNEKKNKERKFLIKIYRYYFNKSKSSEMESNSDIH